MKNTGQAELFLEIWMERPHICFITGRRLKEPSPSMFAHVLPKGAYKKFMLEKKNIVLMHPDIHHQQHSLGKEELINKYPKFLEFFQLQDSLRTEYNERYLKNYRTFD